MHDHHDHQCDGHCDGHHHDQDEFDEFEDIFDEDEDYTDEDFLVDLDIALADVLKGTPWEEKIQGLDEETLLEDRLKLYQAIRDAEALPPAASFMLIAWTITTISNERASLLMQNQYVKQFERLEEQYNIDPVEVLLGEVENVPAEYQALVDEYDSAVRALTVATFQAFGEHKMAALYKDYPQEYDKQYNAGFHFFFNVSLGGDFEEFDENRGKEE